MKYVQLLASLVLIFICSELYGQKKSVPGYYITQKGDTVKGVFPKYTQWIINPSEVEFAVDGSTSPILLTPTNTQKFVVEGYDEYLSFTGTRLLNPIEDAALFDNRSFVNSDDSLQQVVVFLRLIVKTSGGELYLLNDKKRSNFFYQVHGATPTELRYKKTFIESQIREIADYRQQLYNLHTASIIQKKLTPALENLQYKEESLASFLQNLFSVENNHKKPSSGSSKVVISAGLSLNMVSVKASDDAYSVPGDYGSSFSPLISFGIKLPLDRGFGKFFFSPQVALFRYKNTGESFQGAFINSVTYQSDLAVIAQVGGGVNLLNAENRKLFISGGFGAMGQVNGKQVTQLYAAANREPYLKPHETKLPKLTYAVDVSVGVEVNKSFLLTATYMLPTNIGNFVFYSPKLSGIQVTAGYIL
jgi:hypothetical protein